MTFIDYIFLGLEGEDWTLFIKYPFWKVPQNATVVKHSIIKKKWVPNLQKAKLFQVANRLSCALLLMSKSSGVEQAQTGHGFCGYAKLASMDFQEYPHSIFI